MILIAGDMLDLLHPLRNCTILVFSPRTPSQTDKGSLSHREHVQRQDHNVK